MRIPKIGKPVNGFSVDGLPTKIEQLGSQLNPQISDSRAAPQAPPRSELRPTSSIKIGKRFRRDLGDLDGLAASIEGIGLLNPITVEEDGLLLAEARRLAACKQLGWKDIR